MKLVLTLAMQGFPAISGRESKFQGKRQGETEELYGACGMVEQEDGVRADFLGPSFSPLCYCGAFPPSEYRTMKGWYVPQDIWAMMG